jgi:hypothetical protein
MGKFSVSIVLPLLLLAASCSRPNRIKENSTFSEDIAPIIFKNCAPCHRPGEVGPFPLLTYEDVSKKAKTIVAVTQSRFMPPWPADPSYSHFAGERVLGEAEIQLIKSWVEHGSPAGDPAKLPPQPQFNATSKLGPPDLVVKLLEPIRLPGDHKDRFFVAKIPYEIPREKFVRAIEFVPGNRKLMHHMNAHIVQYEDKKKNPFEGPYVVDRESLRTLEESYNAIHLLNDDGSYPELTKSVANYLPGGVSPAGYANGIGGWKLNKKGAFLMRRPLRTITRRYRRSVLFQRVLHRQGSRAADTGDATGHARHFGNHSAINRSTERRKDIHNENASRSGHLAADGQSPHASVGEIIRSLRRNPRRTHDSADQDPQVGFPLAVFLHVSKACEDSKGLHDRGDWHI